MKMINLNSRKGLVNLLADYVVSKLSSDVKSIIQITDCGSFYVINGITESSETLDIPSIVSTFEKQFSSFLDGKKINTIDLISYGEEPKLNENIWFSFINEEKILCKLFVIDHEFETLQVSSSFPHGYSINSDRNKLYYSEYICNQLFSVVHSDEIEFMFGSIINDEQVINIKGNCIYSDSDVESMILDVFDFNLESFNNIIKNYDLMNDLLNPLSDKPWLAKDKIRDMIIF